jgi:N-acetyl-gamma-glutamyl-phosphate reductase
VYGHALVSARTRVGIIGASGYTGAELLRILAGHPGVELVLATGDTQAGTLAASLYPSLRVAYPDLVFSEFDAAACDGLDVVFLGLPHEASLELAPQLVDRVGVVIDLSAAYRLKDASSYPRWYGFEHTQPELLARAVYGLPERHRASLAGARLVATPGCYVTAATLALAPLVDAGLIETVGVVVDAASGVSGAGRSLKHSSLFCTVDEDFTAYGLLDHRHTPEMEQEIGAQLLFTPHLVPMNRGILATCYARPTGPVTTAALLATLGRAYAGEPFVSVRPESPSTKATLGSNAAHLSARYDERTGWVIVLCAIDNLAKGASGGAVQAMNVAVGLPETAGLTAVGVYP